MTIRKTFVLASLVLLVLSDRPLFSQTAQKQNPSAPANIRRVLKQRGVTVRRATPETVTGSLAVTVDRDVVYGRAGDRELKLDLFVPRGTKQRRPGILVVHGGGWLKGDKQKFHALAKGLALRGYVAAAVGYRLGGEAKFPAAIHDCNAATRWLRANAARFHVDVTRIGAVGGSAGGHLVGLMAAAPHVKALQGSGGHPDRSSALQAAVVLAGPMQLASGPVARKSREQPKTSNANKWFGKTIDEAPALYRLASPFTHFSARTPPLLFQRGQFDAPPANVEARTRLTELRVPARAHVYQLGRHGCWNQHPWFDVMLDDIDTFLAGTLGDPSPGHLEMWARLPGISVRRGDDRLELTVETRPANGVIRLPRLNNPIRKVLLKSAAGQRELSLKPQLKHWEIRLPAAGDPQTVIVETIGRPWWSTLPRVVSPVAASGDTITLAAHDGVAHGKLLRYEPQPHKNTLGYWAQVKDWCEWSVYVERPGSYQVHVLQGCGKGHGGSQVAVTMAGQSIKFTVEDTGGFQAFKDRDIGRFRINKPGLYQLQVRPISKASVAVMDVRRILLKRSGNDS